MTVPRGTPSRPGQRLFGGVKTHRSPGESPPQASKPERTASRAGHRPRCNGSNFPASAARPGRLILPTDGSDLPLRREAAGKHPLRTSRLVEGIRQCSRHLSRFRATSTLEINRRRMTEGSRAIEQSQRRIPSSTPFQESPESQDDRETGRTSPRDGAACGHRRPPRE
jgi:hypothetical protein